LIDELTVDADKDEKQLAGLRAVPTRPSVVASGRRPAGVEVEVLDVDCGPDARTGLLARVRHDHATQEAPLADLAVAASGAGEAVCRIGRLPTYARREAVSRLAARRAVSPPPVGAALPWRRYSTRASSTLSGSLAVSVVRMVVALCSRPGSSGTSWLSMNSRGLNEQELMVIGARVEV